MTGYTSAPDPAAATGCQPASGALNVARSLKVLVISAAKFPANRGVVMRELDDEDYEELENLFDLNDSDSNGSIDFGEFCQLLGDLGADMSKEELEIGFNDIDSNASGEIDFDEFSDWWGERI